ncbi:MULTISPECIES: hypothetical protein [unclassified Streptomyces]|uniref:hypothetical protein n=1 Tax=unclassified Streptomyces TaxID=2593676 RepID=UPI00247E5DDA|nr:alpha-L-arabinofuranosidase [Streptomyces sp. SAI-119]
MVSGFRWEDSVGPRDKRAVRRALAWHSLVYANHPSGTALSDLRVANGTPEPRNMRMWCLGNKMDGRRQTGFLTAVAYSWLGARTAGAKKVAAEDLELVVCGSSGCWMPTFGDWERTVLEHTYDHISYQELDGDLDSFRHARRQGCVRRHRPPLDSPPFRWSPASIGAPVVRVPPVVDTAVGIPIQQSPGST